MQLASALSDSSPLWCGDLAYLIDFTEVQLLQLQTTNIHVEAATYSLVLGISDRTRLAQTVARRLVWNATGDSSYVLWWKVTWHQTRFLVGGDGHKTALHPRSLSSRPWKKVVRRRSFPVKLREGILSGLTFRSWTHGQMLMLPASEPRIVTTVDCRCWFSKNVQPQDNSPKNYALHWPEKRYACWATLSP